MGGDCAPPENKKAGLSSGLFAHINKTLNCLAAVRLSNPSINHANNILHRLKTASHQYW